MIDGGNIPAGALPVEQFQPDSSTDGSVPPGAIPADQFQSQEQAYGTTGQQVAAGLEGAASGLISPTLTGLIEKHYLGIPEEDIRGRAEANPVTHGIGEVAGFGAGMLTGTGEAALMGKAGQLAAKAAGLGEVAKGASIGYRVGSEAVKQAAEMAVMQGDNEVSKMMLHDPETSAESAIANTGISAALGAGTGAVLTGVVSPLWKATVGDKFGETLGMLRNRVNGETNIVHPDDVGNALKTLEITPEPLANAALSTNPQFRQFVSDLRRGENPQVLGQLGNLQDAAHDAVVKSLNIPLDEISHYSEKDAGERLLSTFKDEFKDKYEPIAARLDARDAAASGIPLSDADLYNQYNKILEQGMNGKFGTNSPLFKEYDKWGSRLLDADTIGKVDSLKTEIQGEINKAVRAADTNTSHVLQDIKSQLADFQDNMIESKSAGLEKEGAEHAGAIGQDIIAERKATNQQYRQFRQMADDLASHTGLGDFTGYKGLVNKMSEKTSPEQLLNKFSPKSNAQIIPFLQENFPSTLEEVQKNEMRRMLRSSVYKEGSESKLDIKKLGNVIDKAQAGKTELLDLALPKDTVEKVRAANTLVNAIPSPRDSGTPAGIARILMGVPTSAMAAVGWLMGHNPLASSLIGHTVSTAGVKGPEAVKLAYLNFLASEKPINSAGFKAAVDFMNHAQQGQNKIDAAVKSVFRGGTAGTSFIHAPPTPASMAKLDKLVANYQDKPTEQTQVAGESDLGHYMGNHQQALTQTSTRVAQYLANVKPKPYKTGPLDKEIPPSKAEEAAYERTKTIAQNPLVIMEHVKHGTLQPSDIKDLNSMYPSLYANIVQKCSNMMNQTQSDEHHIPYTTRMGVSLLCGQPMDSTMLPANIMAAQPQPPPPPAPPQQKMKGKGKSSSSLNKMSKDYQTPGQNAESDRSSRD